MTAVWRLVLHGPVDGALNMAIDRAVQLCREQDSSPPTLRLYRWSRPTVTLGRFQPPEGVDAEYCFKEGIDVVRRFTGGRGVLHDDEITYSVVASADDGIPRGVVASYRYVSSALVASYRGMGVDAALTARDRGETSTSACYLQTTRADLSVGRHKLSGSAQVWHGSTVLQHGSFLRSRKPGQEAAVFRLDEAQASTLDEGVVSLADMLDPAPSLGATVAAVVEGFEQALDLTLEPGELSAAEAEVAAKLVAQTRVRPAEARVV